MQSPVLKVNVLHTQATPNILPTAKPQDNDAREESKINGKDSEQSSRTASINFASITGISKVNSGSTNAILEAGKRILLQQSVMQRLQLQHVVTVKEKEEKAKANDHLSMQQDVTVKPIPKVEVSVAAFATKPQTKKDVNVEKVAPIKATTSNNSDNKMEAVISVVEKTAKVDSTKKSELIKSADINSNAPNNASKEQANKLLEQIKQLAAKVTDKQEPSKDAKKVEVSKEINKAAVKVAGVNSKPALVSVPVPNVIDRNALQTKNSNLNKSIEEKVIVKPTQKVEVSAAAAVTNKPQEPSKDAKKAEVSKEVNKAAVKVESVNTKPVLVTVPVPNVIDNNALQTRNPNLNASIEEKVIVKPAQKVEVSAAAVTNKSQVKKETSDEKVVPIKATTSNNPDNKKETVTTTTEKAEKVDKIDPAKKNEIKNLLAEIQRVEVEKQIKGIQKSTENTKTTSKSQAANSGNDYPEPMLIINK